MAYFPDLKMEATVSSEMFIPSAELCGAMSQRIMETSDFTF
jgi:hypothetical protein